MSDMKKLLESIDKLTECPPMEGGEMPPAPTNPGNPVTLSVNFNASGKEHVADLLAMMKNAGLGGAEEVTPQMMPMRQDMERLRAIVGEPEMEADAAYGDVITDDENLEEWDNEPEAEYQDHKFMTKDLSGGLNREKKSYAAAQPGDNAMAVEAEDDYVGAIEHWDGTIVYPKIGDTVELFYSSYTDGPEEDHKPNAIGKIVGKGDRDETFVIKWKDHTSGDVETDEFSAVDEFKILDKDAEDPNRIKGRKQGQLGLQGGKTGSRRVGSPKGKDDYTTALHYGEDMAVEADDDRDELSKKLFRKQSPDEMKKRDQEKNRKMNQKRFMKPGKTRSGEWGAYESEDKIRETIKAQLMSALNEKKAKPDYLDMDKDGNKKEPMKKAIADKKKKAPVKEADYNTLAALARLQMQHDAEKKYRDSMRKSDKSKDDLGSLARLGDPETIAGLTRLKMQHDAEKKYRDSMRKSDKSKDDLGSLARLGDPETIAGLTRLKMQHDAEKKYRDSVRKKKGATKEAEVQAPTHELSDTARKATNIAQMIKRKINSGEQMDDRDYNQMAELGSVLSRFGASFGPKSMKDVMAHMVQYTNDRNEEGHNYPEMNVDRFKELITMAK